MESSESILDQILSAFPHVDAESVIIALDFVGFMPKDISTKGPSFRLIKGRTIFLPEALVTEELKQAQKSPA